MPELLRAYGEVLRQRPDSESIVFAVLSGAVFLVLAIMTAGALVQATVRGWQRFRKRGDGSTVHGALRSDRHTGR